MPPPLFLICFSLFHLSPPTPTPTPSLFQVKLSGGKHTSKDSYETSTIKGNPNPRWFNDNKFTLYDVNSEVWYSYHTLDGL